MFSPLADTFCPKLSFQQSEIAFRAHRRTVLARGAARWQGEGTVAVPWETVGAFTAFTGARA